MTKLKSNYRKRFTACASKVLLAGAIGVLSASGKLSIAQNINLADPQGAAVVNILGYSPNSFPSSLFSPAGDTNGDGFADFLIGSPLHRFDNQYNSRANLVLGSGSFTNLELQSFESSNARGMFANKAASAVGMWVAGAGDFNGDGRPDVLIGSDSQSCYLVYGSASVSNLNLTQFVSSNTRGFEITGTHKIAAGVGDINHDGYDDIVVADPDYDVGMSSNCGKVYVILGRPSSGNISLSTFTTSAENGFTIVGTSSDSAGKLVASAGDFNNDGIDDMVLGGKFAFRLQAGGSASAACYLLVKGQSSPFADIDLAQQPSVLPVNCFTVFGSVSEQISTMGASAPGTPRDFNGDGYSDLFLADRIAAPDGASNAGAGYLIYGRDDQTTHVSLSNLATPSSSGLRIDGIAEEQLGWAWSWAGDVNGDDLADVILASYSASHNNLGRSGSTYCIYGKTTFTATLDLSSNFITGQDGFRVDGPRANQDLFPVISTAGDTNGDGFDDFLIGHSFNPASTLIGDAYLIFGHPAPSGIAGWMRW